MSAPDNLMQEPPKMPPRSGAGCAYVIRLCLNLFLTMSVFGISFSRPECVPSYLSWLILLGGASIPLLIKFKFKKQWHWLHLWTIGSVTGLFLSFCVVGITANSPQCQTETPSEQIEKIAPDSAQMSVEPLLRVEADINKIEDQSHRVMSRPLSSYSYDELQSLPMDKKMAYRVVIKTPIRNDQVKEIVDKMVVQLSQADPDIDEMTLWLYSDKTVVNGAYDVAMATWAPYGELGNVTEAIATNNDRSSYKTTIEISQDDLYAFMTQRNKQENKLGMSEATRRAIRSAYIKEVRKASQKVSEKFPPDISPYDIDGAENYRQELERAYRHKICQNNRITEDQLDKISIEAITENWPLE